MKNLIATAIDEKYADFLINHWYKSLSMHNDLANTDVLVLDYGLSPRHLEKLTLLGVLTQKCSKDGIVPNLRIRDMVSFLRENKNKYGNIIIVDGGDIIFQANISPLFNLSKVGIASHKYKISKLALGYFKKILSTLAVDQNDLRATLLGKDMYNVGVVAGPVEKVIFLFEEAFSIMRNLDLFMLEQFAINYILHKGFDFSVLSNDYNFMYLYSSEKIKVESGVIKYADGRIIPIVHNLGKYNYKRPFKNFGFGKECNKLNAASNFVTKTFLKTKK